MYLLALQKPVVEEKWDSGSCRMLGYPFWMGINVEPVFPHKACQGDAESFCNINRKAGRCRNG